MQLSKIRIPHVFIFLSIIILISAVLTYVVPSGSYERTTRTVGNITQQVVVPGSYKSIAKNYSLKGIVLGETIEEKASPTSFLGLFSSIPKGMTQAASLIFFIFIIGAVFNIIQHSGTINVFMHHLMTVFKNRPWIMIFGIYTGISAASSLLGMAVEFIPLIPLFLLIAKEYKFDRVLGVSLLLLPMSIGWTSAISNPYTVQIAQTVAELPIGSGMGIRVILFFVSLIIGFSYLFWYGNRIKKDKNRSLMKDDAFELDEELESKVEKIQRKHVWILVVSLVLFGLILYAVQNLGWGLLEMAGGFLIVGVLTIFISRMNEKEAMHALIKGLETMIIPALIVGVARAIQVVLQDAMVIDTLLFHTSSVLEQLSTGLAVQGMFFFQAVLNFFIPSASGQALVTMPLMVPLADLLNISRQTSVLAFILGDGYTNLIIPTNGVLMAILGVARVPFEKWFKFVLPLFLLMFILAVITLLIAVNTGY